ncbi:MAG: hypothetical protein EBT96_12095 [Betaproteobacteria bacterium]|nr:hypothetical protein [Betaproteobacteria bacterium]
MFFCQLTIQILLLQVRPHLQVDMEQTRLCLSTLETSLMLLWMKMQKTLQHVSLLLAIFQILVKMHLSRMLSRLRQIYYKMAGLFLTQKRRVMRYQMKSFYTRTLNAILLSPVRLSQILRFV